MIRVFSFGDQHTTDHGADDEELSKPNGQGKTLCGRRMVGTNWFTRGNVVFNGKANYHCVHCVRRFHALQVRRSSRPDV